MFIKKVHKIYLIMILSDWEKSGKFEIFLFSNIIKNFVVTNPKEQPFLQLLMPLPINHMQI